MSIFVAILLGVLALACVLYPLYRPVFFPNFSSHDGLNNSDSSDSVEHVDITEANAVKEREQTARVALQEVELDYQLGNIAEPEYRSLRERYMRHALVALKSRHDREQEIDEEIEAQLRALQSQELKDHHEDTK